MGADDPEPDEFFAPPATAELVACLHCAQSYESYLIEWRVGPSHDGVVRGFWSCPTPGCGGVGYGCDIHPVDSPLFGGPGGDEEDDPE